MPILAGLCDDETNLWNVVSWTGERAGQISIAGQLTLADQHKVFFFQVLREHVPDLVEVYERLYPPRSCGAVGWDWRGIALRLKELCGQHDISHRMPRPIIPGDKRVLGKRVVEALRGK